MEHGHDILAALSVDDAAPAGRTRESLQARSPAGRNRSQQILDDIFASDSFRELERGWAETAKRDAEKRHSRPVERAPDRMINMEARREFGTYRGRP